MRLPLRSMAYGWDEWNDPGLDPQGALLQPMACTHELERSKPWRACAKVKGHGGKRGSKGE
ncbi:hypothetical protein EYF80_064783 [Liparis tanakae]|uniref:Uncharacterized protein n=1 Tax=Liparis tanakae TaxID=230148 RepID=A0A4Z2E939_9TELE|nr:hypothetical protein EYF80_064783 [Liparis tanakae]